jgi:hypothetical protein
LRQTVRVGEAQLDGTTKIMEVTIEAPPDAPPPWAERVCEYVFDQIFSLNMRMTIEFLDAAIFGYAYAAISRERAWRMDECRTLPPELNHGLVHQQFANDCKKAKAARRIRLAHEQIADGYQETLESCRSRLTEVLAGWKLPDAAEYLEGFAYGIKRQDREAGWTPSTRTTTMQVCKALLVHRAEIEELVSRKATARKIGQYVGTVAVINGKGMTLAESFQPSQVYLARLEEVSRKTGKQAPESADTEAQYHKLFQGICANFGIPLPQRGRPRRNS